MSISRREFLASAAGAALSASVGSPLARNSDDTGGAGDVTRASVADLARAIRSKTLSAEELVGAYLRRIDALNGTLNAIVHLDRDGALAAARRADRMLAKGEQVGALHGVPITLKDSLDTEGMLSTAGTLGRAGFVPQADATVVSRVKAAGAIVLGKTNTPELTFSLETVNRVYGRTVNPYDLTRSPGGSSGGAAAAIAAGMSALDIGSDTGASVRYPAHCCGIAGLKPTHGRVPRTGHIISFPGVTESLTTLGPLARCVEDLGLVLPIIAGPDARDPHIVPAPLGEASEVELRGLRAATYTDVGEVSASEATQKAIASATGVLSDAGVALEPQSPPRLGETLDLFLGLFAGDGGAGLAGFLEMLGTKELSAPMRAGLEIMKQGAMSTAEYQGLVIALDLWRSKMLAFMEQYDLIVCPVCAHPAPKSLETWRTREDVLPPELFAYTAPFNLTGWPVAVVRIGSSPGGLPIGVQIVARPWREDVALAVAALLERALGGFRPPPL